MLKITAQRSLAVGASNISKRFMSTEGIVYPQLTALVRPFKKEGSRNSRYLRKDNILPGVLYGMDDDFNVLKTSLQISQKDVMRELRIHGQSFENTVYELTVNEELQEMCEDGTPKVRFVSKFLATPRQTQFSPVTEFPLCVNFLRYRPGMRVRIPLEYKNADLSQDLKRGSFLVRINQFVECVCDAEVPQKIIVDLTDVKKGDVVKLSRAELPPLVRPSKSVPLDYVLGVIQSTRS